jgi:hypothetical protein
MDPGRVGREEPFYEEFLIKSTSTERVIFGYAEPLGPAKRFT